MFTCLPPSNENEWFNLKDFVMQYNAVFEANYALISFPELEDSSRPQPEVFLQDGNKRMVIERKVFAWPPDHVRHHQLWHEFFGIVFDQVTDSLTDDIYVLEIGEEDIPTTKREVRLCARQIALEILSRHKEVDPNSELVGSAPISWRFFRLHKLEREDYPIDSGIVVRSKIPHMFGDTSELQSLNSRIHLQVIDIINRSALKFENYSDCLRILIIELYTNVLSRSREFLERALGEAKLPPQIDQVWLAELVELDDQEKMIVYHQVNSREGDPKVSI